MLSHQGKCMHISLLCACWVLRLSCWLGNLRVFPQQAVLLRLVLPAPPPLPPNP